MNGQAPLIVSGLASFGDNPAIPNFLFQKIGKFLSKKGQRLSQRPFCSSPKRWVLPHIFLDSGARKMSYSKLFVACTISAATLLGATHARAATVTFDFETALPAPFTHDEGSQPVGPGNCLAGSCIKVNRNSGDVISIAAPLTFSVTSFWFQLLGNRDNMLVSTNKGSVTLLESMYENNNGFTYDATAARIFDRITYVSFIMDNEGNGRVDNLTVTYDEPSSVPLPAGGALLVTALAGLAAMRRRKVA